MDNLQITKKHTRAAIAYVAIIIFALSFLYFGNRIANEGIEYHSLARLYLCCGVRRVHSCPASISAGT